MFQSRKEFEYARFPNWSQRYTVEKNNICKLAFIDDKLVGSLGLLIYEGYIQKKKKSIGFFVDNCVDQKYHNKYDTILSQLFEQIEIHAKKKKIDFIFGWDYKVKADEHQQLFTKLGYSKIDGINWFGGGTKHIQLFPFQGFTVSPFWKLGLGLYSIKHKIAEMKVGKSKDITFRDMKPEEIKDVTQLINNQNQNLECSPRYTNQSLQDTVQKYQAKITIIEKEKKIIGTMITFLGTWSGWMYGKPELDPKYGIFLIKHPLEIAVQPEYQENVTPHLFINAMNDTNTGKYAMFVDICDRRVEWLRQSLLKVRADELPYDYGTIFWKNLSETEFTSKKPVYIPTNLVISPYTGKYS